MPDPNNILDPKTKTIWFCVPKAANSSIKRVLLQMHGIVPPETPYELHNHEHFQWTSAEAAATAWRHYLRIAVVRNPYTRLYSLWRDKCAIEGWWESIPIFGLRTGMTFREFCDVTLSQYDHEQNIHYRPQTALVCYRNKVAADIVVKMEELQQQWIKVKHRVADHCGVHVPDLPKINVTGVKANIDNDLRKRISTRYAQDFLHFGYDV
jgi:hypothetical protein